MRLYLVRSGGAGGEITVKRVARHLKEVESKVTEIWYAPDGPAQQTAELLADGVGIKDKTKKYPSFGDAKSVSAVIGELKDRDDYVMLVAEQSFLHGVAGSLFTGSNPSKFLEIPPGGLWFLTREDGKWTATG